ncbi:hypothetical protein BC938DRAFT_480901, partial [Jimgerdemannia flammicorona]
MAAQESEQLMTSFDEYNSSLVMEDETIEAVKASKTRMEMQQLLQRHLMSSNALKVRRIVVLQSGNLDTKRPEVESEITDNPSNQDFWHTDFENDLYVLELDLLPEEERVMLEEEEGTKTKQDWKKWGTDLRRAAKMPKHKH